MASRHFQRVWPWMRDLGIALLVLLAFRAYQQRDLPSGLAPELAGVDLQGRHVSLADYRGKPVMLQFWATWCGVCRAEQGSIDALAHDHAVLSVASRSGSSAQVAAYVRAHGFAARVLVDPSGAIAQRFGVRAFPTTLVLDANGTVQHAEVGYTTEPGLRLRMWLAGAF